jgi:hypothetical protein
MKNTVWLIAGLLFLPSMNAGAQSRDSLSIFQKANAAYRGGDYAEAANLYESLIAKGEKAANVYFNLGNAYFKQERLGQAILYYEKAKRVKPRDRDIRTNLNYAGELLEYRIEDKRNWYFRTGGALLASFTQKEMGIVSLGCGVFFWLSWIFSLYFRPRMTWGWRRRGLLFLTGIVLCLWLLKGTHDLTVQEAVVLKPQAAVRYGPSHKDQVALRLGDGMKVRLKRTAEGWSQVVLTNGETGWMFQEELGVI